MHELVVEMVPDSFDDRRHLEPLLDRRRLGSRRDARIRRRVMLVRRLRLVLLVGLSRPWGYEAPG
jgi:hypothetical protein